MAERLQTKLWTKKLTGVGTFTFDVDDSVRIISVYNSSTTTGTVLGAGVTVGGEASSAIDVAEGETYTMQAVEGSVLGAITVTAPSGCTLQITAGI